MTHSINADARPVKTKSRRIVSRSLRWEPLAPINGMARGWLTITQQLADDSTVRTLYLTEEVGSDAGRSFDLLRPGERGDSSVNRHYVCHIGGEGLNACNCRGNAYRGTCVHADALTVCLQRGLIEGGILGGEPEAEECDNPCDAY